MILEDKVVNIKNGVMPKEIKDDILKGSKIKFSKDRIWFYIPNIATYCIINGSEIIVEVAEGADMQLMKVYLMCSCLGFIMLQRDMVAIHGGVIEMDDKAVIFTGDRGAGKSTLTTALRRKGYKFISYAVWWIRQAIIKALSDQCRTIRIPLSQTSKNGKLAKVIEQFEQVEGRKPTSEELSAYINMSEKEINTALSSYNRIVSLTTPFNDDEAGCLLDIVPNSNSELSDANEERKDNSKILEEILSKLPYRDRDILRMSLGLGIMPMQNEEIANRFGIGYERVRQIVQHSIEYLRENCMEEFKELI